MNVSRLMWPIILTCGVGSLLAEPPANDSRPSPDGQWVLSWGCHRTWQPDSCTISLSRRSNGKVFFTHHTSDRYIQAVWNPQSTKCLLLDAPENANSYLWLFRVHGHAVTSENLDYDAVSRLIETAVPEARPGNDNLTRSGIEKIIWHSGSQLRLHITYNNVRVVAVVDVATRNSPQIRIARDNET